MLKTLILALAFLVSVARADESASDFSIDYTPAMPAKYLSELLRSKKWIEPVFGPEFTFASSTPANDTINVIRRCHEHLIDGQCAGTKFAHDDATFYSPNRWNFTVAEDKGVVEVTMAPLSVEEFEQYKGDIQDAIFASASNVNLFPEAYLGGGHISISYQAFLKNPLLLRNFIVDCYNHSELGLGIMNYDTNNALPLLLMTEKSKKRFLEIIKTFDEGRFLSVDQFRVALSNLSHGFDDFFVPRWRAPSEVRGKYAAVNLNRLGSKASLRRIEIRSIRAQSSMDIFTRQIHLFRDRLKYLDSLNRPIPIKTELRLDQQNVHHHLLNPPVNAQGALRMFYQYVKEAGQRWQDHTDYIWPKWIQDGELKRFESSTWFRQQEGVASATAQCAHLLQVTP